MSSRALVALAVIALGSRAGADDLTAETTRRLAARRVTLDLTDTSLATALDRTLAPADVPWLAGEQLPDRDEARVTLAVSELRVRDALNILLRFQGHNHRVVHGVLVVFKEDETNRVWLARPSVRAQLGRRLLETLRGDAGGHAERCLAALGRAVLAQADDPARARGQLGAAGQLVHALGRASPVHVVQPVCSPAQADVVRRSIDGLAAVRYSDRQAALRQIQRIGPAALAPLQAARAHADPEARRRVGQLLAQIERVRARRQVVARVDAVDGPTVRLTMLRGALPTGGPVDALVWRASGSAGRPVRLQRVGAGRARRLAGELAVGELVSLVVQCYPSALRPQASRVYAQVEEQLRTLGRRAGAHQVRHDAYQRAILAANDAIVAGAEGARRAAGRLRKRHAEHDRRRAGLESAWRDARQRREQVLASDAGWFTRLTALTDELRAAQAESDARELDALGLRLVAVKGPLGCRVEAVAPRSVAAAAGLRPGDVIIGVILDDGSTQTVPAPAVLVDQALRAALDRRLRLEVARAGRRLGCRLGVHRDARR